MHKLTINDIKVRNLEKLKLSDSPEVLELIENSINAGEIVEVKRERGRDGKHCIAVVRISRNLIYPKRNSN
jgi:hypothetical protein